MQKTQNEVIWLSLIMFFVTEPVQKMSVLLHVQSETGTLHKIVSLKSTQWRLSKWPSFAIFKNADLGTLFFT